MSCRALYTSPDDLDYLNAFGRFTPLPADLAVLSEPLWLLYAETLSTFFNPEMCLRITIFVANFLFLCCFLLLSRWNILYVTTIFVFNFYLATLFYFIQIRVGLAIGCFLLFLAVGVRPVLAAIICSAIHASFLFVTIGVVLGFVFGSRRFLRITGLIVGVAGILLMASAINPNDLLANITLGRRDGVYALERISNLNFYVLSVGLFLLSVPNLWTWIKRGDLATSMTSSVVAFYLVALASSFVSEAGTRLVAMGNIFALIHLSSIHGNGRKFMLWITAFLQILLVVNEFSKGHFGPDSWFVRWALIAS
jgi:hypothetical protein